MNASADHQHDSPRLAALHRGDSFAASVLVLVLLAGTQRFIGLLRNVLFCGMLEDEQLGRWSLAFNFLLLAAPLVVLGIPGSFGRYVEHFRQKGQLRTFMRRTLSVSAALTVAATAVFMLASPWLAWLLFGDSTQTALVHVLAFTLIAVVAFNLIVELLTALRLVRLVSLMQVACSFLFASLGCGLLFLTSWGEQAVIGAYGAAALVAAVGGGCVIASFWRSLPGVEPPLAAQSLWSKLVPFATWIWIGNLIANLFEASDQFMLKHFSNLDAAAADALVGQYYASRIVPLLLVSLAMMIASSLLPHLTRDWESGSRDGVRKQVNRAVKSVSVSFTLGASVVLLLAPVLFAVAFRGRYDGGLTVLPGTLMYCTWYSIACVAHSYLLCAENARVGSLAFAGGLGVNLVLNYFLAPLYGLTGVVLATASANVVALAILCYLSHRNGMRWDRGVLFASLLPLALCLGGWQSLAAALLACTLAWRARWLCSADEKQELIQAMMAGLNKLLRRAPLALRPSL